nr:MAG TPA: hypothetical protein [Caudoviricetes sp.]DAN51800.1 MAG TPA: hypothetical protein [Caudoviricetes sp.]DAT61078.1 MAG TPA: hypothetical protein [Caudoviricetes sp.]
MKGSNRGRYGLNPALYARGLLISNTYSLID